MAAPSPSVPPRRARTQNLQPSSAMDIPSIPPRPRSKRSTDRSISPNRDTFARSPLNDPTYIHQKGPRVQKTGKETGPQIRRPPSVSQLPSIGQEGSEYTVVDEQQLEDASPPEQTKNVEKDLPLHAPTASVPAATAKARIATVTRTDQHHGPSGLSKLVADNKDNHSSANRSTSSLGGTRPSSIHMDEAEHGIPMIGVQVPMYPNAGDVQAPTPSQTPQHGSTGVGFFNNGGHRPGRQHTRTKSGRQVFHGPPGSYGLHGHGVASRDPLEKSWYDKHPDDAAKEAKGEYGPKIPGTRKEYHLSQDDLNKLVHHRLPPTRAEAGTPAEELGYQVSEEYASRMTSPKVGSSSPGTHAEQIRGSGSQAHAGSPLYKTISGSEITGLSLDHANESHESLGLERTRTEEDRWAREHGYTAPILAADEVAKHEFPESLQPAVSPDFELERVQSADYSHSEHTLRKTQSRPESRNNGSNHALPTLTRFSSHDEIEGSHTPLENVQEYEPLFPEDEKEEKKVSKKPTAVDKLKRPDLSRYHFPSQDIWEDAPSHVHLSTTVETPEPEDEVKQENANPSKVFESPATEEARKENITKEDQQNFLSDHTKKLAKTHLSAAQLSDMPTRPGVKQRFPSQDIWEDAPDNVHQYTSVDTPEEELDEQSLVSPVDAPAKPVIPARPARTKAEEPSSPEKKAPVIPERPKPQVPVRPAKTIHRGSNEPSPLEKTLSASSAETDGANETGAAVKQKPPVPARPGGSKIASLKAGFMSDLNSRLQLGPQAPKTKELEKETVEEVKETAPLLDARKGRAKGPSRRRPAASPSGEVTKPAISLSIASAQTVWSLSDDGDLVVGDGATEPTPTSKPVAKPTIEVPQTAQTEAVESAEVVPEAADEAPKEAIAKSPTSEQSTQTGQLDIRIKTPTGEKEEITAFLGGNAHDDGDVIVKDGIEHVSGKSLSSPPAAPSETQSPALEKLQPAVVEDVEK